jgi:hypothetical protein
VRKRRTQILNTAVQRHTPTHKGQADPLDLGCYLHILAAWIVCGKPSTCSLRRLGGLSLTRVPYGEGNVMPGCSGMLVVCECGGSCAAASIAADRNRAQKQRVTGAVALLSGSGRHQRNHALDGIERAVGPALAEALHRERRRTGGVQQFRPSRASALHPGLFLAQRRRWLLRQLTRRRLKSITTIKGSRPSPGEPIPRSSSRGCKRCRQCNSPPR